MPAPITANTIATSVIVVNSVCCGFWLGVEVGFWCGVSVSRSAFGIEIALVSGDVKNGIKAPSPTNKRNLNGQQHANKDCGSDSLPRLNAQCWSIRVRCQTNCHLVSAVHVNEVEQP